ncbi:Acg family FMN-binding oxidoreductase [Rhodococcus koreensis]
MGTAAETMPSWRMIESVVASACRAPSLHNSQPWRWVLQPEGLTLSSDPDRILPATDSFGRQMVVSCGAALNHLKYALLEHHWDSVIQRMPHSVNRQCLATVAFTPTEEVSGSEISMAAAIARRYTERLPMSAPTSWDDTLAQVTELAERAGTHVEDIGDRARPALEAMSLRLRGLRRENPVYQAELHWWAGHALYPDGIPSAALPAAPPGTVPVGREFPPGTATCDPGDLEDRAAILVLTTGSDSRLDWLRCGEALSALLLACTARGLGTCPVTHMTELGETRTRVSELLEGDGLPQVLIRVGIRPRSEPSSTTPRRPLSEVLFRDRSEA